EDEAVGKVLIEQIEEADETRPAHPSQVEELLQAQVDGRIIRLSAGIRLQICAEARADGRRVGLACRVPDDAGDRVVPRHVPDDGAVERVALIPVEGDLSRAGILAGLRARGRLARITRVADRRLQRVVDAGADRTRT